MQKRENIFNVPNLLTMLRMAMIGVFVWIFAEGWYLWAAIVFLAAGATDMLDGYIARKYRLITDFGKMMDPLADKLMLLTALTCLLAIGWMPAWVVAVVAMKESSMVFGSVLMYKRGIVAQAQPVGKAAQMVFSAAVIATFLHETIAPFDLALQCAAVILTVVAFWWYMRSAIEAAYPHGGRVNR